MQIKNKNNVLSFHSEVKSWQCELGIYRYGFIGADTDISAIHGPTANTNNWYF